MSWNDCHERKCFVKKLISQKEEYKKLGMTDAQIEEIEKLDWEIYRSNRRFSSHTQPLEYDDDFEREARNPLLSHFVGNFSENITPDYSDRFWWIDEIEDENIYALVKKLTFEEKTILAMIAFDECSRDEICRECGISRFAVHRRINALRKRFSEVLNREAGDEHDE